MLTREEKIEALELLNHECISTLTDDGDITLDGTITTIECIEFAYEVDYHTFELIDDFDRLQSLKDDCIQVVDRDLWENDFAQCDDCGLWFYKDDLTYTDSDNCYCDNCVEDHAQYCEYHEQWEERERYDFSSVNTAYGLQNWCCDAVDDGAFYCEYYEEYYSKDDYNHFEVRVGRNDYETWSEYAINNNACWCSICEEYVNSDYYYYEEECCEWCANESRALIGSYHSSKEKFKNLMFGVCKYIRKAGGGFELEITRDNRDEKLREFLEKLDNDFGDHIAFEHDSSIGTYGIEIVSAPHTKDGFYEMDWAKLLETCKEYGYKSHDGGLCGLHWHISATMFGGTNERAEENIAKLVLFYDTYFEEFVKLSRRTTEQLHWCGSYSINNYCDYNFERAVEYSKSLVKQRGGDRYKAINLTNTYARCGEYGENSNELKTVEFRINRGTLNVKTFYATIDIIFNLVRNCKKMNWTLEDFSRENVKKWFSGCKKETYEYIVKRGAFADVFYTKSDNENTTNEE